MKDNYLYQGGYSELDEDIGWNDFALRNYDAQIGRWVQQDPYQEFATPYVGMGGDPVNLTDPSGGSVLGLTKAGFVLVTTVGGAIIGAFVDAITGNEDGKGIAIGAGIGLAAGLGSLIEKITWSMAIGTANTATTIINNPMSTLQAGKSIPQILQKNYTDNNTFHNEFENILIWDSPDNQFGDDFNYSGYEIGESNGPSPIIIGPIVRALSKIKWKYVRQAWNYFAKRGPAKRISEAYKNRLKHIFGKVEHKLDDLVKKFGSEEKAFDAVQRAANEALKAGKLKSNSFGILSQEGAVLNVGGMQVRMIGGIVKNGKVIISSFSRKGL